MALVPSLSMALLLGALAPFGAAPSAHAAKPQDIPADGVISLLPVADAVADGRTLAVHVTAITGEGAPATDLALTPEASAGEVSGWRALGPGAYAFDFTPPSVDSATEVTLGLASTSVTVKVRPAPPTLGGSAKPPEIVLGELDGSTLLIDSPPAVLLRTGAGSIADITDMGARKTARFLAPKVNFPHIGIVTMVQEADPFDAYGTLTVILKGAVDFPVEAPAGSEVTLEVAGASFGPVEADEEGKAKVPIVVPPGVTKAALTVDADGKKTQSELDLGIPATKRLALFPLPAELPADSRAAVPVRVAVVQRDGAPDTDAPLTLKASAGEVGKPTHEADGIYLASWSPPDSDASTTATIEAQIGDAQAQHDSVEVQLVPRRLAVSLATEPAEITPKTNALELRAHVTGAGGAGIPGRGLFLAVRGATVEGALEDRGGGDYALQLTRSGGHLAAMAAVRATASPAPVHRVLVLPGAATTANNGKAVTQLLVATVDRLGQPVANIPVSLDLVAGDGRLVDSVTTDATGLASVTYQAGTEATLARFEATAAGARGGAALWQLPSGAQAPQVPVEGSTAAQIALVRAWASELGSLGVKEEAQAPPPPAPMLAAAGTAATIVDVTVSAERVAPGGTVTIQSIPRSGDDLPIPGQALDVLAAAGTLGDTTEAEGVYTTELTVPGNHQGPIKIQVIAPSGVMALVSVEVSADALAAPAAAAVAEAEPDEEPKPPKEPKEPKPPKEPREPGDNPWLRARLSGIGSTYRYEQAPNSDPGPLLPQALAVGGPDGGRAAVPVGGEVDARAWLEALTYLGFHAMYRSTYYAIESSAFQDTAPDWLYNLQLDVAGRYPFDVGSDQFWVGGKAGFHYNDFIVFTGCLETGCEVTFNPLGIPGLGLGAEIGAEIADLYFIGGYTHGLANFTVPYSHTADVNVGYGFLDNVFADAGFTAVSRRVALEGDTSGLERGTLSDLQLMGKLGIGFSL